MDKNYFLFLKSNLLFLVVGLFLLNGSIGFSQTTTVTALSGASPYCSGAAINVTYAITGAYTGGNVFTAQLSNSSGSFASGVTTIGTRTATNAGVINATLPYVATSNTLYRIRVISSTPVSTTTTDNGYGFTINPLTINTPVIATPDSCQGEIFTVPYTVPCATFPAGNVFTAQLISPTSTISIGTLAATGNGNITCTIPAGTTAGTNYSVNVVSSNTVTNASGITSPLSSNINIYASSVPAGGVGTPGNGFWNAYCYSGYGNYTTDYMGYYTENNLNLNSTLRNANTASPSTANNASGNAYAGCPYSLPGTLYAVRYIRTGIPCGYYSIAITSEDDQAIVILNGTTVFSSTACCTNWGVVWQGFIAPTTTVEIRYSNNGGPGNLAASVTALSGGLNMPTPVTVCAGTTATLTASNSYTTAFSYAWSPAATATLQTSATANPSTASVSPITSTVYTLTATDNTTTNYSTTCSITNTVNVTVNALPTTTVSATLPSYSAADSYTPTAICSGVNTATLTAGGAYTYTWSPASGLSSVNGYSVVANPTVTTTYTVSGSNNCATVNASTTITVQTPPTTPTYTTFGSNVWNAYCNYNTTFNDYYGYYTENNLSYNTTTRWVNSSGPSTCTNTSTGLAYSGCSMGETEWSISFKRTNTPCGYYSLDINYQDDQLRFLVNGVSVFYNGAYTPSLQSAVWQGFIGPTTTLEFQLVNIGGPGQMQVTFNPITYPVLSPPVTICATSSTTITATPYIAGANYVWTPNDGTLSTTTGTTTVASPTANETYTCVVTDPVTTCSASATDLITVNPLPTTTVSPTAATTSCSINGTYTLTAGGANTYSWSPSAGLSTTTGYSVVASPTVTTTYTVAGNNNCATINATSTITVIPLVSPTVFPSSNWNVYCYGDQTETNYYGYYTAAGSGTTGYDFNSATQWTTGSAIPSNTNGTSPTTYYGCTMPATNWSLSYKRTGFTCGTYSINILNHDDNFTLYINGTQVAQHIGCCDAHTAIWVGTLNAASTIEVRLVQGGGSAQINVSFVRAALSATQYTWIGGTSADWFTAANWCGSGSGIPTSSTDVIIPAAGPQNMPAVDNTGAQCRSITINPAIAAGTYNSALPSASLNINATYTLDVYGNWNNGGSLTTANNCQVNMDGTTATTMSCSSTQAFYNLNINNSAGVTMSSGTTQVSNNLNFTSGIITQNATLQLLNGATVSGVSNTTGYVIGPIVKYGNQAFTFPVGGDNLYRPIAISAPSLTTDNFTAQYFYANVYAVPSYTTTNWDLGIDHLSGCEYWILNRTGGTSNVNVTLSWNTNSCGVTNLDSLIIARYDAGSNAWKNHGNGGYTGNTTAGTIITSAPVTNFSPFVLASSTKNTNPLPVQLLYFSALPVNNTVDLNWATATEVNNDYFTIEKSKDGINFNFLKQVPSEAFNGNSNITLNYKTYDLEPYEGINYYRLTQTDRNGNNHYANITQVNFSIKSFVSIFPNPASNMIFINVSPDYNNANLKLTDALGREILTQNINSSNVNSINTSALTSGMYIMIIDNGNGLSKTKITIQK
jgi:hypothetical protein